MQIIGISGDCEHGSAVALIRQGELVYAESEERLSRIKCDGAFPHRALEQAMSRVGGEREQLFFAAPGIPLLSSVLNQYHEVGELSTALRHLAGFDMELLAAAQRWAAHVERVEHHLAHARCAAYCASLSDGLVLTADGQGDGVSIAVWKCREGMLECSWRNSLQDGSVGFFFAAVTEYLGYRRLQDEGKVTALAASGVRRSALVDIMKRAIELRVFRGSPTIYVNPSLIGSWTLHSPLPTSKFAQVLRPFAAADIALAAQERLEQVMLDLVPAFIDKSGCQDMAVAGGLFANVGLNRRLGELSVRRLFVAPPMGDEGLAIGAAIEVALRHGEQLQSCPPMFLGCDVDVVDAEQSLGRHPTIELHSDSASAIALLSAHLLARGEVVARCAGLAEFGPRALGNRSLLYRPDDPSCREWLNRNLGRDSVMPFAPCVRLEDLNEVTHADFERLGGLETMTIAVPATIGFQQCCPAVVHRDGTARIQVVVREKAPQLWDILAYFHSLTGLPALLNTSLNRHGEPICRSLDDAIVCAVTSGVDFIIAAPTVLLHRKSRAEDVNSLSLRIANG